ncbi:amino acid ABC transporter permease [Sulfitobacter alexandrii]|nr:ABC transporter permease subunit [Sulfitobacter alexandrii]
MAQVLFVVTILVLGYALVQITQGNLDRLSVKSGYGFLAEKAPFELGESLIPFSAGDTYLRAFVVGILNTLKVAALGIVLSTVLGLLIALGQLSPSVVVARVCRFYIETARNVPLLMQLIFWYALITASLPRVKQALSPMPGVYLSNRGLNLPSLDMGGAGGAVALALLAGMIAAIVLLMLRRRIAISPWFIGAVSILPALLTWAASGAVLSAQMPELKGFNFRGGMAVSPEFLALLLGLTIYTAAFNAEVIRAGVLGVPKGQREAATALGLKPATTMRLVIIPQALRIIIPPMGNNYLNLTKESSLAVAIGYPEVVRVANITLAETSQSIECISIIMLVFLTISLTTSALLNWFNARAALVSR